MVKAAKYRSPLRRALCGAACVLVAALLWLAALPAVASVAAPAGASEHRAFAEELSFEKPATTLYGLPVTPMKKVRSTADVLSLFTHADTIERGDVFLLISTEFEWTDVTAGGTPSLYEFATENAAANLVSTDALNWDEHAGIESLHVLVLQEANHTELDEVLQRVMALMKYEDSLIVTNAETFLGEWPATEKYSTFIVKDTSDKGLLTSTSTRHLGLISSEDAIAALDALIASPQRYPANLQVHPLSGLMPGSARISALAHSALSASALQESQPMFIVIFVGALAFALACSVLLMFLELRIRPKVLSYLLPAARIMWIIVLSVPLASYLMILQLPTIPDAEICLDYFWFCTMEISFVCIIVALVFRWSLSYLVILAATALTLIIDQLVGGPLSCGSYLSYAPLEGVRFYGIGNEGAALLFGSWTMVVTFYLTRRPFTKLAKALRAWLYPVASLAIIVVICAPWWGANFGVIIWGTVGVYVIWRRFNAHRLRKREVAAAVIVAGIMAFCVLIMDTTFNGDSHMGGQVNFFSGNWAERMVVVFVNVGKLFVDTIVFSPILAVLFVAMVVFLFIIDVKQPGPYRDFWKQHSDFHGAFNGMLISAVLMMLVEDSGILMPALLLLYPLSGLMWFLCNFHSWHIRAFLRKRRVIER